MRILHKRQNPNIFPDDSFIMDEIDKGGVVYDDEFDSGDVKNIPDGVPFTDRGQSDPRTLIKVNGIVRELTIENNKIVYKEIK